MAKAKKGFVKDASGAVVAKITKYRYVMIPVDPTVKIKIKRLCKLAGASNRSQGAMVEKLVNQELAKYPEAE